MCCIFLKPNPEWIDKSKRAAVKYSPVRVSEIGQPVHRMQDILKERIEICQELALYPPQQKDVGWFKFIRTDNYSSYSQHLKPTNVPIIVISGGGAKKIACEMNGKCAIYLAWHPLNSRNEPVYMLVHQLDFNSYMKELRNIPYRNFFLIGWNGSGMSGFGAARAAAMAFADTLPYRPQRILLMDQDVVLTEATRHTSPQVYKSINEKHNKGIKAVGLGVGYPTRNTDYSRLENMPSIFKEIDEPMSGDFNSPVQQLVSISAPFRTKKHDGIYPSYMVAGGEDMLMGLRLGLMGSGNNQALLNAKIIKKELKGDNVLPADNKYWNETRENTLKQLFRIEQLIPVDYDGLRCSLGYLMRVFIEKGYIQESEKYNTSACIVERIILRLHKLGKFPTDIDDTVFFRV